MGVVNARNMRADGQLQIETLRGMRAGMSSPECARLLEISHSRFGKVSEGRTVYLAPDEMFSDGPFVWLTFDDRDKLASYRVEVMKGMDDQHVDLGIPGLQRN